MGVDPVAAVEQLIAVLAHCRTRSAMLVGDESVGLVLAFLQGLRVTAGCCLPPASGHDEDAARMSALRRRKLKWQERGMSGVADQLRARGQDEDRVIEELIVIEIEVFQSYVTAWRASVG